MSRRFDKAIIPADSAFITMNPGAAPAGGPVTFALVFRIDSIGADQDLARAETAASGLIWALNVSGGQLFWSTSGFRTCDTIAANTWYLLAITKAAGTSQVRSHLCDMAAGTWVHTDRGTLPDAAGPVDHIWIGRAFSSYLNGYVAALGLAPAVPNDLAVEALRPGLSAWLAVGVAPLWRLNDLPVADLSGGSGSQSAIQGTTVNTAIEPPSFDYDLDVEPEPPTPEPGPEDQREGSWQQWVDAIRTGSTEYHLYKDRERDNPVECPNDGEPLQTGPDGMLYCRYDGWRPLGGRHIR
jgi:hypothetical protein